MEPRQENGQTKSVQDAGKSSNCSVLPSPTMACIFATIFFTIFWLFDKMLYSDMNYSKLDKGKE